VIAFGVLVIAWLQGFDLDLEIAGIVSLAVLGVWMLASALVAMTRDDD